LWREKRKGEEEVTEIPFVAYCGDPNSALNDRSLDSPTIFCGKSSPRDKDILWLLCRRRGRFLRIGIPLLTANKAEINATSPQRKAQEKEESHIESPITPPLHHLDPSLVEED
jgi:hypothetical protein